VAQLVERFKRRLGFLRATGKVENLHKHPRTTIDWKKYGPKVIKAMEVHGRKASIISTEVFGSTAKRCAVAGFIHRLNSST